MIDMGIVTIVIYHTSNTLSDAFGYKSIQSIQI